MHDEHQDVFVGPHGTVPPAPEPRRSRRIPEHESARGPRSASSDPIGSSRGRLAADRLRHPDRRRSRGSTVRSTSWRAITSRTAACSASTSRSPVNRIASGMVVAPAGVEPVEEPHALLRQRQRNWSGSRTGDERSAAAAVPTSSTAGGQRAHGRGLEQASAPRSGAAPRPAGR